LNFSVESLKERCEKNADIRVVIVQNTLGIACEIEKISDFCKRRGLILIEDLAHSIGAVYRDGREAGTVGDFVVLSFSQDKMVDGVSGGALVVRDMSYESRIKNQESRIIMNQEFKSVPLGQQMRDRFYPLFTWIIRATYGVGLGKVIHAALKRFDLLSKPMGGGERDLIYGLANWYCELIYLQFMRLKDDLAYRRKIAMIYEERLDKDLKLAGFRGRIIGSANLRFPIFVKGREGFIKYLKGEGIFVSDIWYDSPIAPKRFLEMTDYKHECSRSEEVSEKILNLPTHRNVSEKDAEYIASRINKF
jgi:perosamine synthetase